MSRFPDEMPDDPTGISAQMVELMSDIATAETRGDVDLRQQLWAQLDGAPLWVWSIVVCGWVHHAAVTAGHLYAAHHVPAGWAALHDFPGELVGVCALAAGHYLAGDQQHARNLLVSWCATEGAARAEQLAEVAVRMAAAMSRQHAAVLTAETN